MERFLSQGQIKKVLETARQKGMTSDRFQELLKSGILADLFDSNARFDREAVRKALKLIGNAPNILTLTVNYDLTLEQMVARGDYSHVDSAINGLEVRGRRGMHQYEAQLLHFKRRTFTKVIRSEMEALDKERPWEPAKIEHLLAFGDQYPEEQCKFNILALAVKPGLGFWPKLSSFVLRGETARSIKAHSMSSSTMPTNVRYLVIRHLVAK